MLIITFSKLSNMEAKVIATGEIVEVHLIKHYNCANLKVYAELNGARTWREDEIEIIREEQNKIDWEQRRFDLVKAAVQGLISNEENVGLIVQDIVCISVQIADAVIEELKEGKI